MVEFQVCKMERVLEMDGGDGCTTMWMQNLLLNWIIWLRWWTLCCVCVLSHVQLYVTPKTSWLAPLSVGILQGRILEWVATPSSRGSSQLRDWTQVPCIAGRFFTVWATREAPCGKICVLYHNSKNGDTSMFSEIIWRTFFFPLRAHLMVLGATLGITDKMEARP